MSRVYPFRSLVEAGVNVIGGSDAPVELPDPPPGSPQRSTVLGSTVAEPHPTKQRRSSPHRPVSEPGL